MNRFEDVVNKQFLEEYLPQIDSESPVVDKDGKVDYSVLMDMFNRLNGQENPYRFTYAVVHGTNNLIPSWNVPPQFRGQEDRIYKLCLDKKDTWQNVLGNTESENVLL